MKKLGLLLAYLAITVLPCLFYDWQVTAASTLVLVVMPSLLILASELFLVATREKTKVDISGAWMFSVMLAPFHSLWVIPIYYGLKWYDHPLVLTFAFPPLIAYTLFRCMLKIKKSDWSRRKMLTIASFCCLHPVLILWLIAKFNALAP